MIDERLTQVETDKTNALNQSNSQFGSMLENNQNLYDQQNQYATEYEQTQNEALDKQLAFNQQQVDIAKAEAEQNKQTEGVKALNEYTAFTNPYGVQAENMASSGLASSGVSETARLGGFNTYQNRLASANKVYQDAITAYDLEMSEARMNNDVAKAQNALAKLEMQLNASTQFTTQENAILQSQLANSQQLESEYFGRYNTVYDQIQAEAAQAEAIRQYNEQMAFQQQQFAYQQEQDRLAQSNWERQLAASKSSGGSSGYSSNSSNTGQLSSNNNQTEKIEIPPAYLRGDNLSYTSKQGNVVFQPMTEQGVGTIISQMLNDGYSDAQVKAWGQKYGINIS